MAAETATGVRGPSAMLDIPDFEFAKVCFDSCTVRWKGALGANSQIS